MPQLTLEQQDQVGESISRQLFRINKLVKELFGQELTDDEIRRAHGRITQGVSGALQPAPPAMPLQAPASRPITEADLAEGGYVNDRSGQATVRERQRLGIR